MKYEVWNGFFCKGNFPTEDEAMAYALKLTKETDRSYDVLTESGDFVVSYCVEMCDTEAKKAHYLKVAEKRNIRVWFEGNRVYGERWR